LTVALESAEIDGRQLGSVANSELRTSRRRNADTDVPRCLPRSDRTENRPDSLLQLALL
jgi:hypothetical protein